MFNNFSKLCAPCVFLFLHCVFRQFDDFFIKNPNTNIQVEE